MKAIVFRVGDHRNTIPLKPPRFGTDFELNIIKFRAME